MLNAENWLNKYRNLSKTSKLKIAKLIAEEIKDINNKDEVEKIIKFLNSMSYIEDEKRLKKAIDSFKGLEQNKQEDISHSMISMIEEKTKQQELENICKENGHKFGSWEREAKYIAPNDEFIVAHLYYIWKRKCEVCGFEEIVYKEPQELIEERKRKEIQSLKKKIKIYQKKLNEMQGK